MCRKSLSAATATRCSSEGGVNSLAPAVRGGVGVAGGFFLVGTGAQAFHFGGGLAQKKSSALPKAGVQAPQRTNPVALWATSTVAPQAHFHREGGGNGKSGRVGANAGPAGLGIGRLGRSSVIGKLGLSGGCETPARLVAPNASKATSALSIKLCGPTTHHNAAISTVFLRR